MHVSDGYNEPGQQWALKLMTGVLQSSIGQGSAHYPDILGNLADTSGAIRIEEVAAPSIRRSYIIENGRVGGYGGRDYRIGGDDVLIKAQAGAECADSRENGRD